MRGDLTRQQRITLGALVVVDVHARDVIKDLVDRRVTGERDFGWLAQMRSGGGGWVVGGVERGGGGGC